MGRFSSIDRSPVLAVLAGLGLALALGAVPLHAQEGAIQGRVVDASTLQGLGGVQVYLPGTDLGTLTNDEGNYRITGVPAGTQTVRARLIGYRQATRQVEVQPGQTVTLDFQLSVSAVSLEEVVVTATGQRQRRELGNAISTVDAADLVDKQSPPTLNNLLQGNATGVTVNRPSGSVGTASSIKIRGNSSLGLSTVPVVYVDGARIINTNEIAAGVGGQDYSRLNDLNPENIESIEVIKGPAAAALYGTEASAGVIRITTKQGSASGPTRYSIRTEQGATWDATAWWSLAWNPKAGFEGFITNDPVAPGLGLGIFTGVSATKDTTYVQSLLAGTRFSRPFRTGHLQSYAGNVRGGGDNVTYYLSGQYENDQGNLPSNNLESWNGRANFNLRPSETIDVSVSTGAISKFTRLPENDNNLNSIVGNALGSPWWGPMTAPDPNTGGAPVETCFLMYELSRATGAPLADLSQNCDPVNPFFRAPMEKIFDRFNQEHLERFTGSATMSWRPIEQLTNRFTVGWDEAQSIITNRVPVDPTMPFPQSFGFLQEVNTNSRNLTLEGTSSLRLDLTENLTSETTVGAQFFDEISEFAFIEGRDFPAGSPSVGNSVSVDADDGFTRTKTAGVFVQEQLSWKDRIYLTPAIRLDDNSAFGRNLGLQEYPQLQLSWVMSEEPWFPGLFDQFRFRAAWGQSGKQPGSNAALSLLQAVPVRLEGRDVAGIRKNRLGNPDLKPETGEEWEVGFDATFLEGRLDVQFTYYDQVTNDAIVQRPFAPSTGFPGESFVNVAEVTNDGVEMSLDATALEREGVTWNWRFNLSTNNNEITELPDPIVFGVQRHQEGFPFGSYFTEAVSIEGGEPVVADEATFHGHPTPEWEGSLSTSLTLFERLTLYAQGTFAGGHQMYNLDEDFSCGLFGGGGLLGTCPEIFQRDLDDGSFVREARIRQAASAAGSEAPYIQSAEFLRLNTVSLQFDLPQSWLRFGPVRTASLSVRGTNLGLWTAYGGLDPEMNVSGSDQTFRSQFIGLPPDRRVSATLSVGF